MTFYDLNGWRMKFSMKTGLLKWRPDFEIAADHYERAGKINLQILVFIPLMIDDNFFYFSLELFSNVLQN